MNSSIALKPQNHALIRQQSWQYWRDDPSLWRMNEWISPGASQRGQDDTVLKLHVADLELGKDLHISTHLESLECCFCKIMMAKQKRVNRKLWHIKIKATRQNILEFRGCAHYFGSFRFFFSLSHCGFWTSIDFERIHTMNNERSIIISICLFLRSSYLLSELEVLDCRKIGVHRIIFLNIFKIQNTNSKKLSC
jgi:hypothetical protein